MKNKCFKRDIFGDKPTQKMAQKALPILVTYAQRRDPIIIRELAAEIAPDLTRFNFSMRWTLAWIQTTLYKLERLDNWSFGEIPCITAIILDSPEQPTSRMDEQSRIEAGLNTPLPWRDYENDHILPIFEYPHWDKVMDSIIRNLSQS